MNSEQARLVERLHAALVEEIRTRRPEYLRQPFTVAEIYQELVPYRNYRDQIGAAMNGDYEDALLRLLSGSGGYLVLDSEPARKRLLDELQSNNPNTGIFREYAALDVRLNQSRIPTDPLPAASPPAPPTAPAHSAPATPAHSAPAAPAHSAPVPAAHSAPAPAPHPATASFAAAATSPPSSGPTAPVAPRMEQQMQNSSPQRAQPPASPKASETGGPRPTAPSSAQPARTAGQTTGETTPCRWCREELPRREKLRFCPFCGMDVNLVPCRSCGEELEPEWRFCVSCGTQVASEE
jgi:hypothetical protein